MEIRTIKQLFLESTEKHASRTAFQMRSENGFRKIIYSEVKDLVEKVQGELLVKGVGYGDGVVIFSESRPEWAICFFAIVSMGAVVIPFDPMLKKEELQDRLAYLNPKLIIHSKKFAGFFSDIALPKVCMDEIGYLLRRDIPLQEVKVNDPAAILYTSGTTGREKAVVLTHRNIMSNIAAIISLTEFCPEDNFLSILPLFNTFMMTAGFLCPFSVGAVITFSEGLKPNIILKNMQETGVTVMCGVPLIYQLMFEGIMRGAEEKGLKKTFYLLMAISKLSISIAGINLGKFLFSNVHKKYGGRVRLFLCGGAALSSKLVKDYSYLGFNLVQGYGLTESTSLTCNPPRGNKPGSVGKPFPDVLIKIDGDGVGEEILASGPNIMQGYYKQKELTAEVLVNGWLHTGDIGYLDDEGYLFITGRIKDIIVTASGVNIYPDDLEERLRKIEGIKEACVLGVKITEGLKSGTEEVLVVVVPDPEYFTGIGKADDESVRTVIDKGIKEFNRGIAEYKRISRFVIRKEELPRTRLMKIRRFLLRKELNLS